MVHCELNSTTSGQCVSKFLLPNYLGKIYSSRAYMHTVKCKVGCLMMYYAHVVEVIVFKTLETVLYNLTKHQEEG